MVHVVCFTVVEKKDGKTTVVSNTSQMYFSVRKWPYSIFSRTILSQTPSIEQYLTSIVCFITLNWSVLVVLVTLKFDTIYNTVIIILSLFYQIEGVIEPISERPQPPNPTASCPIYRWNLQNKYNYTVSARTCDNSV